MLQLVFRTSAWTCEKWAGLGHLCAIEVNRSGEGEGGRPVGSVGLTHKRFRIHFKGRPWLNTCDLRSRADLTEELALGITILSSGGRTTVPRQVMEVLKLRYTPQKREKILWTQEGDEVVVSKGTPQSSFRKTILSRGGRAAVPKHVREALKLKPILHREERLIWIQKGEEIFVRKGTPQSIPTDYVRSSPQRGLRPAKTG